MKRYIYLPEIFSSASFKRLLATVLLLILMFDVIAQEGKGEPSNPRAVITELFNHQAQVRYIFQVAIHPSGTVIAWCADGPESSQAIYYSALKKCDSASRITASATNEWCSESEPQWSPDGQEIAFLSDAKVRG